LEDSRSAKGSQFKEIVSRVIRKTRIILLRSLLSWQLVRLYQCISSKIREQDCHFKRFLCHRHLSNRYKCVHNRVLTLSRVT
jgi:hypothetical protein